MNANDVLMYGHRSFTRALEGLPEAAWTMPSAVGEFTVQDVVAHMASFAHLLVAVADEVLGNGRSPLITRFATDGEQFNQDEVLRRRGMTPAAVWEEYTRIHAQAMQRLAQIPEQAWRQKNVLPWYGPDYDLEDFIVYSFYGHAREHAAHIGLFRDTLGKGDIELIGE